MNFNEAYRELIKVEGGYVFDPIDSGGETYKGISRKHWKNWKGWLIIDNLKQRQDFVKLLNHSDELEKEVQSFYKLNYWDKLHCGQMPEKIRLELFDTAVNVSVRLAGKYLQRALNLHNRNERDYSDIKVDGKVGANTIDSVKSCKNIEELFVTLNVLQGARYVTITEKYPKNERFYNGWIARRVKVK